MSMLGKSDDYDKMAPLERSVNMLSAIKETKSWEY